jgi:hypothetical protein
MGTLLIDAVIGFTLLEAALLLGYRRFTRRGLPAREYAANLVSGLCLMLALRTALVGSAWFIVAAWLAASGLVHAFDLWRRWPR